MKAIGAQQSPPTNAMNFSKTLPPYTATAPRKHISAVRSAFFCHLREPFSLTTPKAHSSVIRAAGRKHRGEPRIKATIYAARTKLAMVLPRGRFTNTTVSTLAPKSAYPTRPKSTKKSAMQKKTLVKSCQNLSGSRIEERIGKMKGMPSNVKMAVPMNTPQVDGLKACRPGAIPCSPVISRAANQRTITRPKTMSTSATRMVASSLCMLRIQQRGTMSTTMHASTCASST
mmetsp:Transcript_64859/g.172933  ORF Transcript_64859/g.172933 Transcript_64859/m.172933 type:complete len:230 (-) Transcript_64859:253-942(-)